MPSVLAALALASLVPAPAARPATKAAAVGQPATGSERARARLVAAARRHVGKPFRGDCSGFVRHVYREAGLPLPTAAEARSGTEAIVRPLSRTARPRPGDVAFFHRTHDRDPPGRAARNLYTHVAVVESVRGPRVSLIHRGNAGVRRLELHLARRADPAVNGVLRRRKAGDPPAQRYLAGELLGGFASLASARPDAARTHARAGERRTRERAAPTRAPAPAPPARALPRPSGTP
jgi:hypothetical protein